MDIASHMSACRAALLRRAYLILLVGLNLFAVGCSNPDEIEESGYRISELCDHGRFSEALEQTAVLIASEPSRNLGYYLRGRIHEATGDNSTALADYESAASHVKTARLAYRVSTDEIDDATIFVLMKVKRFADAIERIETRLSRRPSDLTKHYDLSLARMALRDFDKAEATLRHVSAFAMDGAKWRSHLALGCILALESDWSEAQALGTSAVADCEVFRECDGFVAECAQAITDRDPEAAIHALELHSGWSFPWRAADVIAGN